MLFYPSVYAAALFLLPLSCQTHTTNTTEFIRIRRDASSLLSELFKEDRIADNAKIELCELRVRSTKMTDDDVEQELYRWAKKYGSGAMKIMEEKIENEKMLWKLSEASLKKAVEILRKLEQIDHLRITEGVKQQQAIKLLSTTSVIVQELVTTVVTQTKIMQNLKRQQTDSLLIPMVGNSNSKALLNQYLNQYDN